MSTRPLAEGPPPPAFPSYRVERTDRGVLLRRTRSIRASTLLGLLPVTVVFGLGFWLQPLGMLAACLFMLSLLIPCLALVLAERRGPASWSSPAAPPGWDRWAPWWRAACLG